MVFNLGVLLALVLSIVTTVPYTSAWWSFSSQNREMNVVNVSGETILVDGGKQTSTVNIALVAVYPKAVIEAHSNMFLMQLAFLVSLDSNITEFICDEIKPNFRSANQTYEYYGFMALSFSMGTLVDFYRSRNEGNIAPFSANASIPINSRSWPPFPQDVSHMLYLTERFETLAHVWLNARVRMNNSTAFISVFFDLANYHTTIYRFNYPPTVWIAYGSSVSIVGIVSINLLHHRKRDTLSYQRNVLHLWREYF